MVRVADDELEQVRDRGYAVIPGFLTADEVATARAVMFRTVPAPERYHADPGRFAHLVQDQFAGNLKFPFHGWELNRLAFHPDLVDAAERYCGTTDLELYKIELWAKYSGAVDYDQHPHRDYGNHTLAVPRADGRWPQLLSFLLLSDVAREDGPTMVVPRAASADVALSVRRDPQRRLVAHEEPVLGPAGTLLLYTSDVFHRASGMRGDGRSRFTLLADYQPRGRPWMGRRAWPDVGNDPRMAEVLTRASVRERDLFGFPPVGSDYWDDQTLRDVGDRYPGLDMAPYREGRGAGG